MSSPSEEVSQVKRLATLIAENDGREGSVTTAERYHQENIEKMEFSIPELSMLADLIEKASGDNSEGYSEKLLLSRFIAEGTQFKSVHFILVVARCYESLTTISNLYTGSYDDYPVVNVQTIYRENLAPRLKWGLRLDSSVYDRMASILVALYIDKALGLGNNCLLRVDVYREVIEVLVAHEGIIRRNLKAIFHIFDTVSLVTSTNPLFRSIRRDVTIDVHDVIRIAKLLELHPTNFSRIVYYIQERRMLDVDALEEHLQPVPALSVGGL